MKSKLESLKVQQNDRIDPEWTVQQILHEFQFDKLDDPQLKDYKNSYAKFLCLLIKLPDNKKICDAFFEKWRWTIGGLIWERHAREAHIYADDDSDWKRDFIYKLTKSDLINEIKKIKNYSLLGSLTLPEGETLWIPKYEPNKQKGTSGYKLQLIKSKEIDLVLGVEINPYPNSEDEDRARLAIDAKMKSSGPYWDDKSSLYWHEIDYWNILDDNALVKLFPCKKGLMKKESTDNSIAEWYDNEFKPTEEISAELFIFKGNRCLTGGSGNMSVAEILENMKKGIVEGTNKILVQLDENCTKIVTFALDGVEIISEGTQLFKTER